jgi:rubrerythrin
MQKGEPMRKTLNEDDVLKEIDRWIGYLDEDMITRIKIGIKKLPSAQPEPRKGEWMPNPDDTAGCGYFVCSACGVDVYDTSDYCPYCGARMMEGEDET